MAVDQPEPVWQVDLLTKLLKDSRHPNPAVRSARNAMYLAIQHQPATVQPANLTPPRVCHNHAYSQKQCAPGVPNMLRYANKANANDPKADKACRIAIQEFCREWLAESEWGLTYYCDDEQVKKRGMDYSKLRFTRKVDWGRAKIIKELKRGRPVLLGLIRCHMLPSASFIPLDKKGKLTAFHWVGVVAYAPPANDPVFLYLDPWPGEASAAMYNRKRCDMMGYIRLRRRPSGEKVLIAPNLVVTATERGAVVLRGP